MPVQIHEFTHNHWPHRATSELVDTDHGPEVLVKIYMTNVILGPGHDKLIGERQEPARAETIIEWWREDNLDAQSASEALAEAETEAYVS